MTVSKVSIKWLLFASIALFAAVMILLLWLFQVVFLKNIYEAIKINSIKAAVNEISGEIGSSDLQSRLNVLARRDESDIEITDMNGVLKYSASTRSSMSRFFDDRSTTELRKYLVDQAQAHNGVFSTWQDASLPADLMEFPMQQGGAGGPPHGQRSGMVYTKIIRESSGAQIAVILFANVAPVDATVNTIRAQLIFITFFMLIFALLLALLTSKIISKPIIRINDSAKALASGNYEITFDTTGYREISELGGTLNYAAGELGKTEQLRRDLIANVSHDLRTPLTMITGYAEMMRDLPNENNTENVQVIIDEANRLSKLVSDVLDLSKLESSAETIHPVAFDFTESIRNILGRFRKMTEQEGYVIRFLHDDGDVCIMADELRVSQVVYNLVSNAIAYTGKDKLVIVRQTVHDDLVRTEVIDTGKGIPKEELPVIWDRYYRAERKASGHSAVGTGLGLSIVKTILQRHGAAFGVQSTVGQGSVFWFEFQILHDPPGEEES